MRMIVAIVLFAMLAACGGGGDDDIDVQTPRIDCKASPEACR